MIHITKLMYYQLSRILLFYLFWWFLYSLLVQIASNQALFSACSAVGAAVGRTSAAALGGSALQKPPGVSGGEPLDVHPPWQVVMKCYEPITL